MSDLTDKLNALIGSGEPAFLLRARDVFAPDTIRFWAGQVEMTLGPGHPKCIEAKKVADQMEIWQKEQARKIPD